MSEDDIVADATHNGEASEAAPALANESEEERSEAQEETDTDQGTDSENGEAPGKDTKMDLAQVDSSVTEDDAPQRSILFRNMSAGFASLRERRDTGKSSRSKFKFPDIVSTSSEDSMTGPIDFCISVNFIDPSTAGATSPSPKQGRNFTLLSQLSSASEASSKNLGPALDLYEKLTSIFERDYSSTLHSIPYENIRNGARGTIEKLIIRSMLTRSHGAGSGPGSVANGDSLVPWGGAAAAPVSDPQEWHNGPYCHVYIAACESMEHYRTKVKPSLQAFVSQIESAANSDAHSAINSKGGDDDMSASGNYSPHYVIVYVPTGPNSNATGFATPPVSEPVKSVGAAFASRLSNVRRRLDNSNPSSRELSDSVHSHSMHSQATSFDGTDSDYESSDLAAAPPPGPVTHSSKLEKELYRKFTTDFPAGRTCIMSTLVDSVDDTSVATTSPLKNQEWNTFLHMLGSAIVSGFKDRCRRYDEELRRLDAHRATATPTSKSWKDAPRFNLSHFFLVKESLAFTYEQMRLPEEALLQYEELRAFVPEPILDEDLVAEGDDYDGFVRKKKSKSKRKVDEIETNEAMELAIAGDSVHFRRRLRSTRDMAPLAQVVLQYLYAREISLLFQMDAPVEILRRSYMFVEATYRMRVRSLMAVESKLSLEQKLKERTDTERWALRFCWDVKCACEAYFSESDMKEDEPKPREFIIKSDEEVVASLSTQDVEEGEGQDVVDLVHTEKDLARTMSDLLEFARNRLIKLGDIELPCENPVGKIQSGLPADMKRQWSPLTSLASSDPNGAAEPQQSPTLEAGQQRELLDGAFLSADAYESTYLELTGAVISFSRFSGRHRFAGKLDGERAEIYIRRGDLPKAAQILLKIVDVCGVDQWETGHFWRLFRLACCQRSTATAPTYLSTLTHCFGPRTSHVSPRKALDLLQSDLEFVVGDSEVAEYPLGIAPFMETELVIKATSSGKSTMPLPYMRKKVINNFCLVGETATFELSLTSHLCKAIEVQCIRLFVVAFDKYEALFHRKTTITDADAFKILSLDAPVSVEPGLNNYAFGWTPMNTGQYILSTVQIQWKSACFYYDSAALRRPLMGVNVTPSDPTQTLELNPLFLIPGHEQQVRIIFSSGSDFIREGTLQLLGFEGLQVIPPGTDPQDGEWRRSCEIALPSCPPGEQVVLTTFVKSNSVHGGDEQSLQAKVATSYYHPLYEELTSEEKESTPAMKTVLEAMVSTLDKPVLSADRASVFSYAKNRVMMSVALHCNTPVPFSIKDWQVKLPGLEVCEDGDLNQELFVQAVDEGEQISFAFECTHIPGANRASNLDSEPTLDIVLEDEFGKTFTQVIPLDMEEFYEQLRVEDESTGVSVTAELYCSVDEGLMGAPVTFTYLVDVGDVPKPSPSNGADSELRLSYAISCDTRDWILSGKVQGILDFSSSDISLEFVGIPVNPGVVKGFPHIQLQYISSGDRLPPIRVRAQLPEVFTSLAFANHMALACPAEDIA